MRDALPSPHDLKYFLEVAQAGKVSRAAERLGISQPSLSLSIQRLEELLGTALLIRSKTGVELTKSGHRLCQKAKALIGEWEKIRSDIARSGSHLSGRYSIGCHPSVANYTLPGILPELLHHHPDLEIQLRHDLSRKITEDVISFKIDFGIVVNPVRHPDLVIRDLERDKVTLWRTKAGPYKDLLDLRSGKAVLIADPDLIQTQSIQKQIKKRGLEFRSMIASSNLEVIRSLTSSGAGIGILPTRVAQVQGDLRVLPATPSFLDQISLIYRSDTQKMESEKLFTQLLFQKLKKHLQATGCLPTGLRAKDSIERVDSLH